jgi:hypothetical protein
LQKFQYFLSDEQVGLVKILQQIQGQQG